jgi:hypothetical protein
MHEREADAAEARIPWLDRRQGEGRRRGVHSVSAALQRCDAGLRGGADHESAGRAWQVSSLAGAA